MILTITNNWRQKGRRKMRYWCITHTIDRLYDLNFLICNMFVLALIVGYEGSMTSIHHSKHIWIL